MAGFYADVPGKRIEYDRDGSTALQWVNNTTLSTLSAAVAGQLNDENSGSPGLRIDTAGYWLAVMFPTPHNIVGAFSAGVQAGGGSHTVKFMASTDSTNGQDGTWTQMIAGYAEPSVVVPNYRTGIAIPTTNPTVGAKGVRMILATLTGAGADMSTFHIYGHPTAATDRLELWHPTLDQALYVTPGFSDLGDDVRGSGFDSFAFRVKNQSATLTANTITLSSDILTDGSPTILSRVNVRYNAGTYGTTAAVGNLAPGAISLVCDARLNVDLTTPAGLWAPRIIASAATWT